MWHMKSRGGYALDSI